MALNNVIVDPFQRREVAVSIRQFITCGQPLMWPSQHEALVQYGIARFVDESGVVKIEEPLALVGILRYFDSMSHTIEQSLIVSEFGTDHEHSALVLAEGCAPVDRGVYK